ncbi:MAG: thioredoxin domain-containing protein [Chloroflexi bacterium]|nr:thioredoxin domain-containing protein [Chloroflexota bacterium]
MTEHGPFRFSPRPNTADAIPWMEWGPDALERARAEDRPILLSISAVWCHRCHVMDETTYSDPRVAEAIARDFVAVRVDADERPDVDARYNAGGCPSTALLAGDGEIISVASFLRPEAMLEALRRVRDSWRADRESLAREGELARDARARRLMLATAGGVLTPEMLDMAIEELSDRFDTTNGGFGAVNPADTTFEEYPDAAALRLLLYAHRRRGDMAALERARFSVDAMARSALHDQVEGGFFRFATRPDRSDPRYEKLGRDQGALLIALAELALVDEDAAEWALAVVERTVAYLVRALGEASGGFYGSQDSDAAYYLKDEAGRLAHGAPLVDRRVYAASTATIARGLVQCGIAFRRRAWVERGLRAVDFLMSEMRAGEAGMYHVWEGTPHGLGLLADQAETLLALLQAYEVSGRAGYLDQARTLARVLEFGWRDPGRAFWDTDDDHDDTGLLAERLKPIAENADAAEAYLWLGRLTHDDRYLRTAQGVLTEFASAPAGGAPRDLTYARVVDRLLSAEPEFKVVAETPPGEPDRVADPLFETALRLPLAARTVQRLQRDLDRGLLDALALPADRVRVAYVCVGRACSPPLTDPEQLAPAVEDTLTAPAY